MSNEYCIRLATPADIFALYQTHRNSVERLCRAHYAPEQIAMWLDGRKPEGYLDAITRGDLWLAEDTGVLGFVEIDGAEVSKLFVAGDHAACGVGTRLLQTAIATLEARGVATIHIEATRNAVPFYEKFQFRVTGSGCFSRGNSSIQIEIATMERSP